MPGNRYFPVQAKIYYAVKSSPVINDVTIQDAIEAGIDLAAEIVCNGTDIPGTYPPNTSAAIRELFNTADVVISKEQGNFGTLHEEEREYFFFK